MMRRFLVALTLVLFASQAEAANKFWVGGTGTWDGSTTTHWSSTSGGAGGAAVPTSADLTTFDGNSGGGTVTVNTNVNVSQLVWGAFTGTIDFSANNNSFTASTFNGSGSATRTFNCGTGAFSITGAGTGPWVMTTVTGLTWSCASASISINDTATNGWVFAGGGLSYPSTTFAGTTGSITGANTFANLSLTAPFNLFLPFSTTQVISNAFTWTGSSSSFISIINGTINTVSTISVPSGSPSITWGVLDQVAFTGGATFSATNTIALGNNTGITVTPPTFGGGGGGPSGRFF